MKSEGSWLGLVRVSVFRCGPKCVRGQVGLLSFMGWGASAQPWSTARKGA